MRLVLVFCALLFVAFAGCDSGKSKKSTKSLKSKKSSSKVFGKKTEKGVLSEYVKNPMDKAKKAAAKVQNRDRDMINQLEQLNAGEEDY